MVIGDAGVVSRMVALHAAALRHVVILADRRLGEDGTTWRMGAPTER